MRSLVGLVGLLYLSTCQSEFAIAQLNVNRRKGEQFTKQGISHVQKKEPEAAKVAFLKASEMEPENPQRWGNLARTQLELGEVDEALSSINKALKLSPTDRLLKETLFGIQKAKASGGGKVSKADSKEASLLTKEGLSHVQNQRFKEAKKDFLKAAQLDHANPKRWGNLARTQIELREYEEALVSVNKGLSLDSKDDMLTACLADIYKANPALKQANELKKTIEVEVDIDGLEESPPSQGLKKTSPSSSSSQRKKKLEKKLKKLRKSTASFIRPKLPIGAPKPTNNQEEVVVGCQTTAGNFYIEVFKAWAPLGAERFLELVESGFFDSKVGMFRVVDDWVAQFGISGDPSLTEEWEGKLIQDDKQWLKKEAMRFQKGFVSFAGGGPNSRNTQLFIALTNHNQLGEASHEVAFGRLLSAESYKTMNAWYSGYGELDVFGGQAPDPDRIMTEGLSYLESEYEELDYITHCEVIPSSGSSSMSGAGVAGLHTPQEEVIATSTKQASIEPTSTSTDILNHKQKDRHYVRSVAAPPNPLPQYKMSKVKEFHPESKEGEFFWWLNALRSKLEKKKQERRLKEELELMRYNLNPNELHVVEDFLSKEERINMRDMILRLKKLQSSTVGDVKTVYETDTNNARNLVAFPPIFQEATEADRDQVMDIVAKVADYANTNLYLNSTLGVPHEFFDDVGIHLGIFAMYEYLPDKTGIRSKVTPHTDTDYDGRCLSAALHLDNYLNPELSTTKKRIKKKEISKYENEKIEGGVFQVMKCVDQDCSGAIGQRLADLHDAGIFTGEDTLEVVEEAPYEPGQLVFFLPESPHTVTPLKRNSRAILFMWFNCHEFNNPPVKNVYVQEAIDRVEARQKEEFAKEIAATRAKQSTRKTKKHSKKTNRGKKK